MRWHSLPNFVAVEAPSWDGDVVLTGGTSLSCSLIPVIDRYNLKDMTWQNVIDTVAVGAMGPPGGGRNHVTPRLLRHFNIFCFLEFDDSTLTRIFRTIVDWHFSTNKVTLGQSSARHFSLIIRRKDQELPVNSQLSPANNESVFALEADFVCRENMPMHQLAAPMLLKPTQRGS